MIEENDVDRHLFLGPLTQIHNALHKLSMQFAMTSDALRLGKPFFYIARQEWQTSNPGNQSHFHILVKNDRDQKTNAMMITADERVIAQRFYDNDNLPEWGILYLYYYGFFRSIDIVDDLVDELLKKVVHHCSERCAREKDNGKGGKVTKCRVPFNPPSPNCFYQESEYSSMHVGAIAILARYGVDKTIIKGSYKYSASSQKSRLTPQIPEKTMCFKSNHNVLACDNKGYEHSYLLSYSLKAEQLARFINHRIGQISEKNGQKHAREKFYSTSMYVEV